MQIVFQSSVPRTQKVFHLPLTQAELDDEHQLSLRTPYRQWTGDVQLYCAWAEANSEAATRTTRAVRDTDVEVPLFRPKVPRVGRNLL
jgi:hypothetical protein